MQPHVIRISVATILGSLYLARSKASGRVSKTGGACVIFRAFHFEKVINTYLNIFVYMNTSTHTMESHDIQEPSGTDMSAFLLSNSILRDNPTGFQIANMLF